MTREEVMARSKELGLDMSDWAESRIQQIVDIVNAPLEFPKVSPPKMRYDVYNSLYGTNWMWPR